jgi:hypothetical protein
VPWSPSDGWSACVRPGTAGRSGHLEWMRTTHTGTAPDGPLARERADTPSPPETGSHLLAVLLSMAMFVLVVDTSLMNVSISAVLESQQVKDDFDLPPHSAAVLLVSSPEAD